MLSRASMKVAYTPLKKHPEQQAFGLKIIKRRHRLGWTQEQLAERSNLHPTYIGSIERGERNTHTLFPEKNKLSSIKKNV